jgi:hypothetical protein
LQGTRQVLQGSPRVAGLHAADCVYGGADALGQRLLRQVPAPACQGQVMAQAPQGTLDWKGDRIAGH